MGRPLHPAGGGRRARGGRVGARVRRAGNAAGDRHRGGRRCGVGRAQQPHRLAGTLSQNAVSVIETLHIVEPPAIPPRNTMQLWSVTLETCL